MGARCLNKSGKNPTYALIELRMTLDEWLAWAIPEYEKFQMAFPEERPCAARRGDVGHYEIGNIDIISVRENGRMSPRRLWRQLKPDGTKRCTGCCIHKMADEFGVNKSRPDGLADYCRICARAKGRELKQRRKAKKYNGCVPGMAIRSDS